MKNKFLKNISQKGVLILLFCIFISLNFSQLSCKQSSEQNSNVISKTEKKLEQKKINSKDYLLDFVLSTSFDFRPYDRRQVRTLLDNVHNKVALVKIFIETDGKGTLGWLKIDFQNQKVYDVTIDPENPNHLTFDHQKFVVLEKDIIGEQTSSKQLQQQKLNTDLLIKWDPANSLLQEVLNPKQIILKKGLDDYDDLFAYRLSTENIGYNPLILSGCLQSGHCEEFFVTTDNKGNEISRLKIYFNSAPDGNEENHSSCTYEIYKDFTIKLSLENRVKEKVEKKERLYKISEKGTIEEFK